MAYRMASAVRIDKFAERYEVVGQIGSGSFATVFSCRNKMTGTIYACKQLKRHYQSWDQVNKLAEIKAFRGVPKHHNLLHMFDLQFHPSCGRVSIVLDLMCSDLYVLIKNRQSVFKVAQLQSMMRQILMGVNHLHVNGFFHRDIKPENILVNSRKNDYLLKLGDFGCAERTNSPHPYTEYISTRWYRAPECLLTKGRYGLKMDMWAVGCVYFELLTLTPLFVGSSEMDQLAKIHEFLGPPPIRVLQKFYMWKSKNFDWFSAPPTCIPRLNVLLGDTDYATQDFLRRMINYDPDGRETAEVMLKHVYLKPVKDNSNLAAVRKVLAQANALVTKLLNDDEPRLRLTGTPEVHTVDQREDSSSESFLIQRRNMVLSFESDSDVQEACTPPAILETACVHAPKILKPATKSMNKTSAGIELPSKKRVTFDFDEEPSELQAIPRTYLTAQNHVQFWNSDDQFDQTDDSDQESVCSFPRQTKPAMEVDSFPQVQENFNRAMIPSVAPKNLKPSIKSKTKTAGSAGRPKKKMVTFDDEVFPPPRAIEARVKISLPEPPAERSVSEFLLKVDEAKARTNLQEPPREKSVDEVLLNLKNRLTDLNVLNKDFMRRSQKFVPQLCSTESIASSGSVDRSPSSNEMVALNPPHLYGPRIITSKFDETMRRYEDKYGTGTISFRAPKPFVSLFKNPESDPPSEYPSLVKVELDEQKKALKAREQNIVENSNGKGQSAGSSKPPEILSLAKGLSTAAIAISEPPSGLKKSPKAGRRAETRKVTVKPKPDPNNNVIRYPINNLDHAIKNPLAITMGYNPPVSLKPKDDANATANGDPNPGPQNLAGSSMTASTPRNGQESSTKRGRRTARDQNLVTSSMTASAPRNGQESSAKRGRTPARDQNLAASSMTAPTPKIGQESSAKRGRTPARDQNFATSSMTASAPKIGQESATKRGRMPNRDKSRGVIVQHTISKANIAPLKKRQ